MMERLTDRARKVMNYAKEEALRFRQEYVGTEHILLGLVKEGSGVAAQVLRNLDIDIKKIRLEAEKMVAPGSGPVSLDKIPLTPRAKKILELAMEEGKGLGHNFIGTEHLLLGLLRERDGVAARVLMNLGLKLEDVRNEVLTVLGAKPKVEVQIKPSMTPRQRIIGALRGEMIDQVPLCAYPGLLPRGETERKLRNEGMGIFHRVGVVGSESPNVTTITASYEHEGRRYTRNTLRTPVGEVYETIRHGGGYGSSLRCEFFIKEPKDYKVMQFVVKDAKYSPAYEGFHEAVRTLGEDGAVIGNLGYTPMMQMLIMWMGPERFAVDYYEHKDEFFSLYEALCKRHEEQYHIAANSPAEFVIYGDNVTAKMIGLERFKKYVVPCYDKLGEALHAKGKRVGSHLDGDLLHLKEAIRDSQLDFIEAYNPPPDGDLSIKEARAAWGKRAISINFTSSIHLASPEQIEAHTLQLLRESHPGTGFIIGVTENIPEHVWQTSLPVINRVLREHGRLPLK
jgi:uroporphyrinogen-III decarboxylase